MWDAFLYFACLMLFWASEAFRDEEEVNLMALAAALTDKSFQFCYKTLAQ